MNVQELAEDILKRSDGLLGVFIDAGMRIKPSSGLAVAEGQPIREALIDAALLHSKLGEPLRIFCRNHKMVLLTEEFDDVYVVIAYAWGHDVVKSVRRMLARAIRKMLRENGLQNKSRHQESA